MPSSQAHRLALDRHIRLWMAGPSGVCCYDGNRVRTALGQVLVLQDERVLLLEDSQAPRLGINPRRQAGLFQPCNRLGAEQGQEEGHGIGLGIVRLLVDRIGGAVGVHSQPGAGSHYWVSLQVAAAPRPPAEPVAPVAAPPAPGRTAWRWPTTTGPT